MYKILEYLTQINPPRNHKNINALNQVAAYIKNSFETIDFEKMQYTVDMVVTSVLTLNIYFIIIYLK